MRQTKLSLLLLLALVMSATGAFAQTVGTQFKIGSVTYEITKMDLGHTDTYEVGVYQVDGTGEIVVPQQVQNPTNHEHYKVTTVIPWKDKQIADGVTSLVLPEGLREIPDGCFRQCAKIQKVTLPSTCASVGVQSFMACEGLTEFKVNAGNSHLKAESGVLLSNDGTTLVCYPSGRGGDYTIPSSVTTVKPYAFSQATKIGILTIPASVVNMSFEDDGSSIMTTADHIKVDAGNTKFCDIDGVLCSKDKKTLLSYPARRTPGLTGKDYTIPEGITTIAPRAFYVGSVRSVNLNDVKTIGNSAFQFSFSLTSVNIGEKVEEIAEAAFTGCGKLTTITVDPNNQNFKAEDNVLFSKDGKHLMLCVSTKTGDYVVPESVTDIDGHAFYQTDKIGKVTISKNVKTIGGDAFGYSGVTGITFAEPSQLETIGQSAFAHTTRLTNVNIPASVTGIRGNAFAYSERLQSVTVKANSQLGNMGNNSFSNCPELTSFQFEGSTMLGTIPSGIFSNDPKLTSFQVPASVTEIRENAFQNTPSMETVTFATPASITTIGKYAFAQSGIKGIELPNTVTKIETQAFDNCKGLEKVYIPENVTSIGLGVFNLCDELLHIDVNDNNTQYASLAGMLTDKGKTRLVVFPAGRSSDKYTMIPNIDTVEPYAFYGSKKLTNITVPKTVTTINNRAIALCTNLKSLSFMGENNVPTLSADIMYESSNPKDITIFVRKKWYENSDNAGTIATYNTVFKDVHPSFISQTGYDRGTEFFPTSMTNAGVISFYTPRTSVIIDKNVHEDNTDAVRHKHWTGDYNVSSVLDYAYENESHVKDIVFLADIEVIGLNAFKAGDQLKGIYFVGDTPGTLNSEDYEHPENWPFRANQTIYVKESKVDTYKTEWEKTGNTLNVSYKIPISTSRNGGSLCYPFDVKLPQGLDASDIKPYVPMDYSRAYDASNPFVRAYSVDNYYVPAFVGALIRSKNALSVNSYCQMDEAQAHDKSALDALGYSTDANNRMVGAVEDTPITNESGYQYYAFSKSQGKFVQLKDGATFPYFKAYFRMVSSSASPAKGFSIMFDDDNTVTGINGIVDTDKGSDNAPYYNLNGVRVSKPSHGVYIQNGKKVIIK